MTARLTDRDMLERTLLQIEDSTCEGWSCAGSHNRPQPMSTCSAHAAAWDLRNYLERHGGWCPVHGTHVDQCKPGTTGQYSATVCAPVVRTSSGRRLSEAG